MDDATVFKISEKQVTLKKIKLVFKPWALVFKIEIFRTCKNGHKRFIRSFIFQQSEFTVYIEINGKELNIYGELKSLEWPRKELNHQVRRIYWKNETPSISSLDKNIVDWIWDRLQATGSN